MAAPDTTDAMLADAFRTIRARSERAWDALEPDPNVLGPQFARGTRWREALDDAAVASCARALAVPVPPALRAMWRTMGGTAPPMRGTFFEGETPVVREVPGFLDPRFDVAAIAIRRDALVERLWSESMTEHDWPSAWGPCPDTRPAQLAGIRALMQAAPRALPIFGHRVVLLDDALPGCPVLSAWHAADTIVYGDNLVDYLVREIGIIDVGGLETARAWCGHTNWDAVPFWGALVRNG